MILLGVHSVPSNFGKANFFLDIVKVREIVQAGQNIGGINILQP
jgi:hypothetical protein